MLDDGLGPDQRFSTWPDVEKLQRGPEPYPEFVIEDAAAIDTELGVLKTGKEADVFLLERATGNQSTLLAAKRFRDPKHRNFRRAAIYNEGRAVKRSRDARALKAGSTYGRSVEAGRWAASEWRYLRMAFEAGAPVPYPVQWNGLEILMEFIADPRSPEAAAPRLHQIRPGPELAVYLWEQLVDAMRRLAGMGFAHGDLSPYNVLVAGERLVVIDLPQLVDLAGNQQGVELLARDCQNVHAWFTAQGLPATAPLADPDELLADLLGHAW
ncbi:hypothetical protein BJH93_10880 [Kocuria polaris]|nr:hypothetical protein [Kocuria polaris]